MIKLSTVESAALKMIRVWQTEYKNSPLTSEMARELKITRGRVRAILYRLFDQGYIDLVKIGRRFLIVPLYWE
jgi:Mn-dependent DtxR family transcriptional regulator